MHKLDRRWLMPHQLRVLCFSLAPNPCEPGVSQHVALLTWLSNYVMSAGVTRARRPWEVFPAQAFSWDPVRAEGGSATRVLDAPTFT